jgi:hypothetical protein
LAIASLLEAASPEKPLKSFILKLELLGIRLSPVCWPDHREAAVAAGHNVLKRFYKL